MPVHGMAAYTDEAVRPLPALPRARFVCELPSEPSGAQARTHASRGLNARAPLPAAARGACHPVRAERGVRRRRRRSGHWEPLQGDPPPCACAVRWRGPPQPACLVARRSAARSNPRRAPRCRALWCRSPWTARRSRRTSWGSTTRSRSGSSAPCTRSTTSCRCSAPSPPAPRPRSSPLHNLPRAARHVYANRPRTSTRCPSRRCPPSPPPPRLCLRLRLPACPPRAAACLFFGWP